MNRQNATIIEHSKVEIKPDTPLANAILIAVAEEGEYEPIGCASCVREAEFMAQEDFNRRTQNANGLCPFEYTLWAKVSVDVGGCYEVQNLVVATITPLV